ncbi:MAG: hypothetical protein RAP03_11700, partial [Candidatus Electryonea clarkiae]|nr:hypothetical protein [Candidatus Electryonea clarkiae]
LECHGDNLDGDGDINTSCFRCHTDQEHRVFFESAEDGHKNYLSNNNYRFDDCFGCHGDELTGTVFGSSCFDCHNTSDHLGAFEGAGDGHKTYLSDNNYQFEDCTGCHGTDLKGTVFGSSCFDCHNASDHKGAFEGVAVSEHRTHLQSNNWDLSQCTICHGSDFQGNIFGSTCNNCHSREGGPAACNQCHGSSASDPAPNDWSPPDNLHGDDDNSQVTVGAHQNHLTAMSGLSSPVACVNCHLVPSTWDDPGHILDDALPADVIFDSLATNDYTDPTWSRETATCSSTYCHRTTEPVWTEVDGRWRQCNTCHEVQLSGSHMGQTEITGCSACHSSVVNAEGEIIDPTLHINGSRNFN